MSVLAYTDTSLAQQVIAMQAQKQAATVADVLNTISRFTTVNPSVITDWNGETNMTWSTETDHKLRVHVDGSGHASAMFSRNGTGGSTKQVTRKEMCGIIDAIEPLWNN